MFSINPTPKLTVLGGVRWERTKDSIDAYEIRPTPDGQLTPEGLPVDKYRIYGSTTYDNVLPNIQLSYNPYKRLVMKAAFTMTIGRPAYEHARPVSYFTYNKMNNVDIDDLTDPDAYYAGYVYTGNLQIGNPELKPWESRNFDLSIEYYTKYSGILSAAFFNKDIQNPIFKYVHEERRVEHAGIKLYTLESTSFINADSGRISGLELGMYQPFRFLPSPYDGFGIDVNATFVDSSISMPHRTGESFSFYRQPDKICNISLFYEKYNFMAKVAWHYEGQQLWEVGENTAKLTDNKPHAPIIDLEDRYRKPYQQFDLQIRYRFTKFLSASFSIRNLTDEREEQVYGKNTNFLRASQQIGRTYNLAVTCNF